ncbi:hypothetical protein RRG08_037286 [Elysia crispata]|uniref:Uncharacterized protein n=1 Tax=Elysia crispata TaxID=231223 RepID=A0AAE0XYP0_9GAST|nr:hypothetical protein RRG08_037286 [Elysia crispata]
MNQFCSNSPLSSVAVHELAAGLPHRADDRQELFVAAYKQFNISISFPPHSKRNLRPPPLPPRFPPCFLLEAGWPRIVNPGPGYYIDQRGNPSFRLSLMPVSDLKIEGKDFISSTPHNYLLLLGHSLPLCQSHIWRDQ